MLCFVTQLTTLILVRTVEFMYRLFLASKRVLFCWLSWPLTLVMQCGGRLTCTVIAIHTVCSVLDDVGACYVKVNKGRFTLYVTFLFRRGTSPFSKLFSCVIKQMFTLTGMSPSRLISVPSPPPSKNV